MPLRCMRRPPLSAFCMPMRPRWDLSSQAMSLAFDLGEFLAFMPPLLLLVSLTLLTHAAPLALGLSPRWGWVKSPDRPHLPAPMQKSVPGPWSLPQNPPERHRRAHTQRPAAGGGKGVSKGRGREKRGDPINETYCSRRSMNQIRTRSCLRITEGGWRGVC